jgi:hypothetical protein
MSFQQLLRKALFFGVSALKVKIIFILLFKNKFNNKVIDIFNIINLVNFKYFCNK